ncbi:LPXTG cell wall anchor domain-containing protein [Frondihabitans cladoniiphilus]|uniref:LPXTG-motif cell wall-anchored protein n=1 Tax=Frondihabitans cladoniiphilus TaxID=715785 RepID=A0ABP8W2X5_9MICO
MLTITLRKALVIPTALTLALGGALLAAGPASAAPATLTVTSSTPTPSTFTVDYKGTTTPGVDIQLIDPTDPTSPYDEETADPTTGAWELTTTFDNTFDTHQQLQIVSDPSGADETQNESVTLPSIAITTPAANSSVVTGTPFPVTGTAPIGSTINVVTASKSFPATVDGTGHFSATVTETYAGTATIQAQGTTSDGEDLNDPSIVVGVTQAASTLRVLTPANGFASTRRNVVFTGRGTAGDYISFDAAGGNTPGRILVGTDGTWTATLLFTPTAPNAETVKVHQYDDNGLVTVNLTLPTAPVVLEPVFVKPASGSTSGVQVTFSGTSQPGTYVSVFALPTAVYAVQNGDATPAQQAEVKNFDINSYQPTPFVLVDSQGNWSVTQTLAPGDWTAYADDAANADATPPTLDGFPDNSTGSDLREFLVAAPAAVTTAATGTTTAAAAAAAKPATLAFTGSNDGPLYGVAGFLLLAGAGLVVVARRRRALQD